MAQRLTLEKITLQVTKLGYKLISTLEDYNNPKSYTLKVECPVHGIFLTSWNSLKREHRCQKCHFDRKKITLEKTMSLIKVKSMHFVKWIDEFHSGSSKFEVSCNNGHHYITTYFKLERGGCSKCAREKRRKNPNDILNELQKYGFQYIEGLDNYKDSHSSKIKIKCSSGHITETTVKSFCDSIKQCKFCFGNARLTLGEVRSLFIEYKLTPLFCEYVNTKEKLPFICPLHPEKIQYTSYEKLKIYNTGCRICGRKRRSGENHYSWNGGITNLYKLIKSKMYPWILDSLKENDYECILSGLNKNLEVHHLNKNFKNIIDEILGEDKNLQSIKISMLSKEEIDEIASSCLLKHYSYGLGVPIHRSLHVLFHKKYGRFNNTASQFNDFKECYFDGEFDDLLPNELKSTNIKNEMRGNKYEL